jgi:hypothetical protein
MSQNPYQAPETLPSDIDTRADRADLLRVGKAQRAIMVIILISIVSVGLSFIFPAARLGNVATGIFSVIFLFRLARALKYNLFVCAILALGSFVPLLGLLILLSINSRATKTLQSNGVRVGLMGANRADLTALAGG